MTIINIIVVFLLKSLLDYVFGISLISVFISDILGEYDSYIIIGYVFVVMILKALKVVMILNSVDCVPYRVI